MPHRRLVAAGVLVLALVGLSPAQSPTVEEQVRAEYTHLVADRLLQDGAATGSASQQLAAITAQLRIVTTQYQMKRGQAEQAEGTTAVLAEQLRQAQQTLSSLKGELDRLRAAPPPAN